MVARVIGEEVPVAVRGIDKEIARLVGKRGERRAVAVSRQDAEYAYLTPESAVKPGEIVVVRGALLLASELAQGE